MTTVLPGVPLLPPAPFAGPSAAVPAPREPVPPPVVPPAAAAPPAARRHGAPRTRTAAAKAGSGFGDALLTAAALLGLLVTALTVFAVTTGLEPMVVRSGSMEPTIPTGGMVLVRTIPAAEIAVGDVIAVDRPDNTRVMHRVVTVQHRGATAEVVLQGDANEDPDPVPLVVEEAGELVFSTPVVGRVSAFLASAKGGFVLGSIVTAVLMTVVRRRA